MGMVFEWLGLIAMQAVLNAEFPASTLTGMVKTVDASSAGIEFVLKSHSGFTLTPKGYLSVINSTCGPRRVDMLLTIHPDYHAIDILEVIRVAVFTALGIPQEATWRLKVAPRCCLEYLSDRIEEGYVELLS